MPSNFESSASDKKNTNQGILNLSHSAIQELSISLFENTKIESLNISNNLISVIPPKISDLSQLSVLDLSFNPISDLPDDFGKLRNLKSLDLSGTNITKIPAAVFNLGQLETLIIAMTKVAVLPPELKNLHSLKRLDVSQTEIDALPASIGSLRGLTRLDISSTKIDILPVEIAKLKRLQRLYLDYTNVTTLPIEMYALVNLLEISLPIEKMIQPPPEIAYQGVRAIISYLSELEQEADTKLWSSKLMIVGEGGVGKTSLLRSLCGDPFSVQQATTRGVDVHSIVIPHPTMGVEMQISCWDFGGQTIYHATHQFFMTDRSLFIVVWNARIGYDQSRLVYWLETIQARAPGAKVLLVATWGDERDPDFPLADLQRKFPQIRGSFGVSNKTGGGIKSLMTGIKHEVASLPMMGMPFPLSWANSMKIVERLPERYIAPEMLSELIVSVGVKEADEPIVRRMMHDLGQLLHFSDNPDLRDMVILRPQWVTDHISRVLDSSDVAQRAGVLSRDDAKRLWPDLGPELVDFFLRLMEQFDLSYRTLDDNEISLVVERLSLDENRRYLSEWTKHQKLADCHEISMRFVLGSVPPGIPTWFIAREHRFTTYIHWRNGALFAYEREHVICTPRQLALLKPELVNLALVKTSTDDRVVTITVRGPSPANFFVLLRDGIELTLKRYPGLAIKRLVPCPGHAGEPCCHEFDYDQVERLQYKKSTIECPETGSDVPIIELLYGMNVQINVKGDSEELLNLRQAVGEMSAEIEARQDQLSNQLKNVITLSQRNFITQFTREQSSIDTEVPNVFTFKRVGSLLDNIILKFIKHRRTPKLELTLWCQEPGGWHPADDKARYTMVLPPELLQSLAPLMRKLISAIKFGAPLLKPVLGLGYSDVKDFEDQLKLVEELSKDLPDITSDSREPARLPLADNPTVVEGEALRVLRTILSHCDPSADYGGLSKVYTPEGHYLWLCPHHRSLYKPNESQVLKVLTDNSGVAIPQVSAK